MAIDPARFQSLLSEFELDRLFNELGWDRAKLAPQNINVGAVSYSLTAIAEKRGVAVLLCSPNRNGEIPQRGDLLKVEREAIKIVHEHLLIFADENKSALTWLWTSRTPGQPTVTRIHTWHRGTSGESLRQKLEAIVWSLDEEEAITLTDVITGLRRAFDRDRVTRRFYDRFKRERQVFAEFVGGLKGEADKSWYASLTLNRLMFVYFIQLKGFLDGNPNYLSDKLAALRASAGEGHFHSFYRAFLRRLFHEGLGLPGDQRTPDFSKMIGTVPYLNGGLFEVHAIEDANPELDIPDDAFERLFRFFDAYDWHLDDRPLAKGNEINPDVLGYIFEKYVNQKEKGAYYTKEDITGYISKNTVIPFLLEEVRKRCEVAFEGESSVWHLLQTDPNRYLYRAMKTGVIDANGEVVPETDLPEFVQKGMHNVQARMFEGRYNLGDGSFFTSTGEQGTLPTETWREYVERRKRCLDLRAKLAAGELRSTDALIAFNLNIRQFMQDIIDTSSGPNLLRAIWQVIVGRGLEDPDAMFRRGITVLDPTCGSGAFLFAALNVLESLYEACLDRMEGFVEDAAKLGRTPEADFVRILDEVRRHPSRRYFVYKTIILHNLYGVDIMDEAVEICKLRLFLKLVSQVQHQRELEPLPDMDFNIRAGNTLVGYATEAQFDASADLSSDQASQQKIKLRTAELADLFDRFRKDQTAHGGVIAAEHKQGLRDRLSTLSTELDLNLARNFGVKSGDSAAIEKWRSSHRPFHWFAEFYGVMRDGGFDVVIGNPPYVQYPSKKVTYDVSKSGLGTTDCGNLYAFVFERSTVVAKSEAPVSLIVQLTAISSRKMSSLQDLLIERGKLVVLPYPRRPKSIFEGVEMPVVILSSYPLLNSGLTTSRVCRMYSEERRHCLHKHATVTHRLRIHGHRLGKMHDELETSIFEKISSSNRFARNLVIKNGDNHVYYQEACRYWLKAQVGIPFYSLNGETMKPKHGRVFVATSAEAAAFLCCLLNSSLFYWYYSIFSDCEHVNDHLVKTIQVPDDWNEASWLELERNLSSVLASNIRRKTIRTSQGHLVEYDEMKASRAKHQIDEIDRALGSIYKLTVEETDFILNYDIKYRVRDADS